MRQQSVPKLVLSFFVVSLKLVYQKNGKVKQFQDKIYCLGNLIAFGWMDGWSTCCVDTDGDACDGVVVFENFKVAYGFWFIESDKYVHEKHIRTIDKD